MQTTIYYFLQVVFCSAIMMGYYWLVLRDKQFHQYNRFYLLMVAGFSWLVPLIKIQLNGTNISEDTNIYYLLSAVADNNTVIESNLKFNWYNLSWQNGLKLLYAGGVLFLLTGFFVSLFRIYQLFKLNKVRSLGEIDLVITSPPYGPMLNKKGLASKKREDKELDTKYSEDAADVGNAASYSDFLEKLLQIFQKIIPKIKPEGHLVVILQNYMDKGNYQMLAWDFARELSKLVQFRGERIWCQDNKTLYPYGYRYSFVPNVHHHYCLVFKNNQLR